MNLCTVSYRAYRPDMGQIVVTSLGLPKWQPQAASWPRLNEATPRYLYLHAEPETFAHAYTDQLDRYGPDLIMRRLADIATARRASTLLLACHERDHEQCHRWLLAEWLRRNAGAEVEEVS